MNRAIPMLMLLLTLSLPAGGAAADEATPREPAIPGAALPVEEEVVIFRCSCSGFLPDHDWTTTVAGHTIGLTGYGDATLVSVGEFTEWIPWRAPFVAGALSLSAFAVFVGAAVTLRPRFSIRREAS